MNMNKENLLKMAEYIATIPQELFGMAFIRNSKEDNKNICQLVGCVIGHCTVLDKKLDKKTFKKPEEFMKWSEKYSGLERTSPEWFWCFSTWWSKVDNTPSGASKRIIWLIEKGLPSDYAKQMYGEIPVRYN